MIKQFFLLNAFCLFALIYSLNAANNNNYLIKDSLIKPAYKLIWSDEFNGTSVDTTSWNFEVGANGWLNDEQEFYQPQNASVTSGNLVITGKKEKVDTSNYTSARMTTKGKHEFLYGRIEARIKLPLGQGIWPAFWMLGANIDEQPWPACGETDIMEHINSDSIIYGTMHWYNKTHVQSGKHITTSPSDYHIYAVEWSKDSIKWFVDDNVYHTENIANNINNTGAFHHPFYLLLNLALGGNWPGQKIDNAKLPAKMYVDYVRVYQ